jgi:hypothetical protein
MAGRVGHIARQEPHVGQDTPHSPHKGWVVGDALRWPPVLGDEEAGIPSRQQGVAPIVHPDNQIDAVPVSDLQV